MSAPECPLGSAWQTCICREPTPGCPVCGFKTDTDSDRDLFQFFLVRHHADLEYRSWYSTNAAGVSGIDGKTKTDNTLIANTAGDKQ